jgi:caa(3)-type oxidase subunit IV
VATSSHAEAQDIAREERRYLTVFFWLFVLTVLEIAVTYLHAALGRLVVGGMLCLLAATKAAMVGLYYMHLVHEKKTLTYIALTPAILCVFLILMLLPDLGALTRLFETVVEGAAGGH